MSVPMEVQQPSNYILIELSKTFTNILKNHANDERALENFLQLTFNISNDIMPRFFSEQNDEAIRNGQRTFSMFNKWFHGHFLHLLGCAAHSRIHGLILKTQQCLFSRLSHEITREYINIFQRLIAYVNGEPIKTSFIVPETFLDEYSLEPVSPLIKDRKQAALLVKNLLVLFQNINVCWDKAEEKELIRTYFEILTRPSNFDRSNSSATFLNVIDMFQRTDLSKPISVELSRFLSIIERLVYGGESENFIQDSLKNVLTLFLHFYNCHDSNFNVRLVKIAFYIFKLPDGKTNALKPITERVVRKIVAKDYFCVKFCCDNLGNEISLQHPIKLILMETEIKNDVLTASKNRKILNQISPTWKSIENEIYKFLNKNDTVDVFEAIVELLKPVSNGDLKNTPHFIFFEQNVLKKTIDFFVKQQSNRDVNNLIKVLTALLRLQTYDCEENELCFCILAYAFKDMTVLKGNFNLKNHENATTLKKIVSTTSNWNVTDRKRAFEVLIDTVEYADENRRTLIIKIFNQFIGEYIRDLSENESPEKLRNIERISKFIYHAALNCQQSESLVSSLIDGILQGKNQQLLLHFICVMSGEFFIDNDEIICFYCNKKTDIYVNCNRERVNNSDGFVHFRNYFDKNPTILGVLGNFLKGTNVSDRVNAIKSLPRIYRHVDVGSVDENFTSSWVDLFMDPDENVRRALSDVVFELFQVISEQQPSVKESIINKCITKLIQCTQQSLSLPNKYASLQSTTLSSIESLAKINIKTVTCLKLITHYNVSINSSLQFAATFGNIADHHSTTKEQLYINYKKDVCRTITDAMIINYLCNKDAGVYVSLNNIVKMLNSVDTRYFLETNHHHLIPYLVIACVKQDASLVALLEEMAGILLIDLSELLIRNFENIFPQVYVEEDHEVFVKCLQFIEWKSGTSIGLLKRSNSKMLINQLLVYYHQKPERVSSAILLLAKDDSECNQSLSPKHLVEYLQPRLTPVLVYFDSKLLNSHVALSTKRKILKSLPNIIKTLIGASNMAPLKLKMMATLHSTLTLKTNEFLALSLNAWSAFVRNCQVTALGPIMSTVFVSLLPFLNEHLDAVNNIFRFIVVNNENDVKNNLNDLFFIVDIDDILSEVRQIVRAHLTSTYSTLSFTQQIEFYLKYGNHENTEVRVYAIQFLSQLLRKNRKKLDALILGNNGIDESIVKMVDLLVKGCSANNMSSLQLTCSECLGELGAIESSHLPRRYKQTSHDFAFNTSEEIFILTAVNELSKAFKSEKHSNNMNCFALALQEILKIYSISPNATDPNGMKIWQSLSDNQKLILQPLLSSRYKTHNQNEEKISVSPIFGSGLVKTFMEWVYAWSIQLLDFMNQRVQKLFLECRFSWKYDMNILLLFLPQILIHAILGANCDNLNRIYNEMHAAIDYDKKVKVNVSGSLVKTQQKLYKTSSLQQLSSSTRDDIQIQAAKIVYMLLDYLNRWLNEWKRLTKPPTGASEYDFKKLEAFLGRFNKLSVAKSNYVTEEYTRALIYLEDYVSDNPDALIQQLSFFTRIYVQLEDADSVAGVKIIQPTEPSLEEAILAHEISGQFQQASACYERIAQQDQNLQPRILNGMVQCFLNLDNPFTACRLAEGFINSQAECSTLMHELQAESLWRLGQYDELDSLLERPQMKQSGVWGVKIGYALSYLRSGKHQQFLNQLKTARLDLVQNFSSFSLEEGAYQQAYSQIAKLHIINELEKVEHLVNNFKSGNNEQLDCVMAINDLVNEWNLRTKIVRSKVHVIEPILCLRRIALQQAKDLVPAKYNINDTIEQHIGKLWLESARVATDSGLYHQAYVYLLNAEKFKLKELFVERAKFHWNCGQQEMALNTLKRGLDEHFADVDLSRELCGDQRKSDRILCSEAKLLIAMYNEELANLDVEHTILKYKEAIACNREWEKSMVLLACYHEKVLNALKLDKDTRDGSAMQLLMMNYYGKSLMYGSRYIYQSMPRMLSIWLDYGTRLLDCKSTDPTTSEKLLTLEKMTKLIRTYVDRLPTYMFLSAFSQIVSRICHPQTLVYSQLKEIIIKMILTYPQQSLWNIMSVCKSSYPVRSKRCQEILQDVKIKQNERIHTLVYDINRVAERLIELCNKSVPDHVTTTKVSSLVPSLPKLLQSKQLTRIMMPLQRFRKIIMPRESEQLMEHEAFPSQMIYIAGIEEEVTIMPSLQRPRRITLLGSDGIKYMHMLKPKDDLRKDFRLMEFNDVVNQYLHMEPESRERRLHIRTYSVVPLNEECGIIEWINDLVGLRPILMGIYKQKGIMVPVKDLRKHMCKSTDSLELKRKQFLEYFVPKHPPVLHEWFRTNFPDPNAWYQARLAYIRTTAVVSMVGYILGLGDRHGENILFDSTNGDTVHVDFNCLFNKGESFEWPERVPFRLTHNMVKAMGPLGVEGAFRIACERSLRVLRSQKEPLMSILKPFVYDPLVSWPKTANRSGTTAERTNDQAYEHIRNIELRLKGVYAKMRVSRAFEMPLSVEGHVNSLILDATSTDNLCQMYLGWGPQL